MPFHVPPISRRAFVVQSLSAGAGALLTQRTLAGEGVISADRWALFSDTHIAEDRAVINRGENMGDNMRRVNAEFFALAERPGHVLHFGDCAFKAGLPGDYETFHALVRAYPQSGVGIHFMLGNHDAREAFWHVLAKDNAGDRPLAGKHVSIVEHPRANWFLLDSLDVVDAPPGKLGAEQLAWLTRELDARAGKPALIGVHHNPPLDPKPGKTSPLTDAAALLDVLLPRRQVKAVVFGHTHTWQIARYRGMHLINLPAIGYPSKANEPTGWVECVLRDDAMQLIPRFRQTSHPDHMRPIDFAWRNS